MADFYLFCLKNVQICNKCKKNNVSYTYTLTRTHLHVFVLSLSGRDSILQLREEKGVSYQRSFPGCQLIDWLLQNGEVPSRRQGLELSRTLLEHGIIQHGQSITSNPHLELNKCICE